jgi:hypothetical protein
LLIRNFMDKLDLRLRLWLNRKQRFLSLPR